MRNTEKLNKILSHKIRALSDHFSNHTDGFLDPEYGREHLFQRIGDIIGLSRIKNCEKLDIISHKFRATGIYYMFL
jgi:hypothetical protein